MNQPDPTPTAENQLLEEGARSYLDAQTALVEFRRQVREQCKKILEKRLDEYSKVLGPQAKLDPLGIRTWAADDTNHRADYTHYGLWLQSSSLSSGLWGYHYFGLGWEKQQDGTLWFGTNVALWVSRQEPFRRLLQQLSGLVTEPFGISGSDKMVWFYRSLTPADMAELETRLDETLSAWIDVWRRGGGIDTILAGTE